MIIKLELLPFFSVYALLLCVLAVMARCRINQSRRLLLASLRMTVQLILAGAVLTYIFENPHPLFTVASIAAMLLFATHRVFSLNKQLSPRFRLVVFGSLLFSSL
ncbi:ABC transporter permease, partial [bacterium]|nr:ABC transporter permease [bacterium]